MTTIKEAHEQWAETVKPHVIAHYSADDAPALAESWNNYTDALMKDGELSSWQYHYCPAWDDDMPEDDIAFLLDQVGATLECERVRNRPDNLMDDMPDGSLHYQCRIRRGQWTLDLFFSQGPAIDHDPTLADILHCVVSDTTGLDDADTFEEWAENYGYDTDSRRAEAIYNAVLSQRESLKLLFTDDDIEQLQVLFQDY